MVERVAFDGLPPRLADHIEHLGVGQGLHAVGNRVSGDFVLQNAAVHVIRAVPQRHLRHRRGVHDPERLDVGHVVQHEPRYRDLPKIHLTRRSRQVFDRRTFRVPRQGDEGQQAVRLVLQFTQFHEVVDFLLRLFHVTVQHGGVRRQAHLVGDARGLEPLVRIRLGLKKFLVDPFAEDLGPAAGQGVHPGFFQIQQDLGHELLADSPDLLEFDHGVGLEGHSGPDFLDHPDDVQVVVVGQFRVHAPDHVDFGDGNVGVGLHPRPDVVGRKHVALGVFRQGVKRTEQAALVADIGVVQVLVAHEVHPVAVHALAHQVGQVADGGQVPVPVQPSPVVGREPLARFHFLVDVFQTCRGDQCLEQNRLLKNSRSVSTGGRPLQTPTRHTLPSYYALPSPFPQ